MQDNQPINLTSDPLGLKPGDIFWSNYRVISVIGKGGVSTVYKAENVQNKQLVAIKVLHALRTHDEELVRRFIREAQTTSKLEHPHAIRTFEWGIDKLERPFMIIEYLHGETLSKRIQRSGGVNHNKAVEIMEQICSAISEAHNLGIIHRDLKPDNVMLTTHNGLEDWVKVVDFGIAKLEPVGTDAGAVAQASLTRTGAILGTPLYMAPEQLKGRNADARSDIYSLGIIMYEMLTGKPPFFSKNPAEVVVGHLNTVPESPSKVRMDLNIPPGLSQAVLRALEKNPWERPTTVQEFCTSLLKAVEKGDKKPASERQAEPSASLQPTPIGMTLDPLKKICPKCMHVNSGSNFRYCLKCGQDNTNKWLPFVKPDRSRLGRRSFFNRTTRTVILAALLTLAVVASGNLYLTRPVELNGRYTAKLDHDLLAKDAALKGLGLNKLDLVLSQQNNVISGVLDCKLGSHPIEGKATTISPILVGYELASDIPNANGRVDLDISGTYDKLTGSFDWSLTAIAIRPKQRPISDSARLTIQQTSQ